MIRLNTGSGVKFTDKSGKPAQLNISRGKVCVLKNVYYKGRIPVHLAGVWEAGCSQPLWVMTSLEDPRKGLEIYRRLMTIEESFKDLKSLLHLSKLMNRSRDRAETMIALTLIAYSLAYIIGETAREEVCTKKTAELFSAFCAAQTQPAIATNAAAPNKEQGSRQVEISHMPGCPNLRREVRAKILDTRGRFELEYYAMLLPFCPYHYAAFMQEELCPRPRVVLMARYPKRWNFRT